MNRLEVVVGGQFGSEAKGHVVQRLTERAQRYTSGPPQVIRVAGPNAGHTGYDSDGKAWALRQVPVAAVTDGPAVLGLAAGSEIDAEVLLDEIDSLTEAGLMRNKVLWVSGEATVIDDHDKAVEAGLPGLASLPERIGSTGKGIGAARARRIMREPGARLTDHPGLVELLNDRGVAIAHADYASQITVAYNHVIIEGTQGYGLGLHAGFYPQCTSSNCRAQDFIAMAGLAPWQFTAIDVWVVARMFPIRVAGNSGPLKNETTWEELGLPEERTTVTKKVRRVGQPDWELVRQAVAANGGAPTCKVALTMVDQMFPYMRDNDFGYADDDLRDYIKYVEYETKARIGMITTGPNHANFIGMEI